MPIPFGTALKAVYAPADALRAVSAGVGAALLGSIFPAARAAGIPITSALASTR